MMYALVVYAEPGSHERLPADELQRVYGEYFALTDDPRCVGGAQLQPIDTATTVRGSAGRVLVTDGPFADTKEVLGGFYLFQAAHLDEAIELASRIPAVRLGGSVEIRPVVQW